MYFDCYFTIYLYQFFEIVMIKACVLYKIETYMSYLH